MAEQAVDGGVEAGWEDDAARWVRRAALVVAAGVVLAWGASMVVPLATRPEPPAGSPYETQAERDRRKGRDCASCVDCGCTGADCIDCGCEALTTTGCDAADCATCEALDCGGCEAIDCGALDCGSCDCGAVDCGGLDCSGCDVACSVAPGVTRTASVARSARVARSAGAARGAVAGATEPMGERASEATGEGASEPVGVRGPGKSCRRAPPVGSALALGMPLVLLAIWRRSPGRGNKRKPGDVQESQAHDEPEKAPDERRSGE